jgi:hypothetical protein
MSNPFFSVIVCTARADHPFTHHRDWHVLDKIAENCQKQTFKDFELVLVDLLYHQRSGYFSDAASKYNFKITHIPDKKSVFQELKLPRISSSKNTGIIFSIGKHLIFSDDGQEWPEHALENLSQIANKGMGASCKYLIDEGNGPVECDSRWVAYGIAGTQKSKRVRAGSMGFFGGTLSMVSLKMMLSCNGWDEMFDGSRQLEDGEMAHRLGACGCLVTLNGEVDVVEHSMDKWGLDQNVVMPGVFLKCNGAYLYPFLFKLKRKHTFANDRIATDKELLSYTYGKCDFITSDGKCRVSKDYCLAKWKWITNPEGVDSASKMYSDNISFLRRVYCDSRLVFSLKEIKAAVAENAEAGSRILFG